MNDQIVPAPLVGTHVTAIERHRGHIGRGGMRHVPQTPHACTSSSPRAVPAQNGAEVTSSRSGSRNPVDASSVMPSPFPLSALRAGPVGPRSAIAGRVRDGGHLAHRRKRTAEVGTPSPLVTSEHEASATWLVDVPRIWRTPSSTRLNPCTYASDMPPPAVLVGSRPFGHSSAPSSVNAPPSPRSQNP